MSELRTVNRQFYTLPKYPDSTTDDTCAGTSKGLELENEPIHSDLLSYIRTNVIGSQKTFSGPYGLRSALYLDFVASGRALKFIEDYICTEVLPEYGNTHTTTNITSLQTTLFRHEARDIIRNACNASEHDSVIFVGSGTTGAVNKLVNGLRLSKHTIVLTGPYEHHTNILPWIEAGAKVVRISETESGNVNLTELEECLQMLGDYNGQVIGAFNVASNVTGVLTNVDEVTVLLHSYAALAFWDYAAAAPYVEINMNPFVGGSSQHLIYKDAVYFSVHKFVGGVDCPGVLIAKKSLFLNPVPTESGGGTVFYVRRDSFRYLKEPEMREEGGTPAIVGSIRAGLVFQLKQSLGTEVIHTQDVKMLKRATDIWSKIPNLVILGPPLSNTDRLPIFSFLVYHPLTGRFLHHNFVAAVLNDVFGIQSRGGCACAGPYAMDLLGLKESVSEKLEQLLIEDSNLDRIHLRRVGEYSHREILRPGFVRINLPYFLDDESVNFVLEAVSLVAEHAWKLLPQYLFNPETAEWRHKQFQTFKDRKWLGHISYASNTMSYHQPAQIVKGPLPASYQDCINAAKDVFTQAKTLKMKLPDQTLLFDDEVKPFRWFVLPSEAYNCLSNRETHAPASLSQLPFCPPSLLQRLNLDTPSPTHNSAIQKIKDVLQLESKDENERNTIGNTSSIQSYRDSNLENEMLSSIPVTNNDDVLNTVSGVIVTPGIAFSQGMIRALENGFSQTESQTNSYELNGQDSVDCDKRENRYVENISKINEGAIDSLSQGVSMIDTTFSDTSNFSHLANNNELTDDSKVVKAYKDADIERNSMGHCISSENDKDPATVATCKIDKSCSPEAVGMQSKSESELPLEVRKRSSKWFSPPKIIFKSTVSALEEYNMLHDGDKVLICLSGGKDSLSLLHSIRQYQFYAKGKGIHFEFGAVTIDPQTPSYDPSPLKQYLSSLDVPYFYESQCIMETANNLPYECASICSFCSRMKRGRIYAAARREGYNVLALGQHLDDLAESFMMSFLHNGALNTMKANYTVKEGDLRVIRPFIYVRETDLRIFAEKNKLPIIAENCPACFEAPKERHRIKQLLAAQEVMFPQVYSSMLSAMKPLMAKKRQAGHDTATVRAETIQDDDPQTPHDDDFHL